MGILSFALINCPFRLQWMLGNAGIRKSNSSTIWDSTDLRYLHITLWSWLKQLLQFQPSFLSSQFCLLPFLHKCKYWKHFLIIFCMQITISAFTSQEKQSLWVCTSSSRWKQMLKWDSDTELDCPLLTTSGAWIILGTGNSIIVKISSDDELWSIPVKIKKCN